MVAWILERFLIYPYSKWRGAGLATLFHSWVKKWAPNGSDVKTVLCLSKAGTPTLLLLWRELPSALFQRCGAVFCDLIAAIIKRSLSVMNSLQIGSVENQYRDHDRRYYI